MRLITFQPKWVLDMLTKDGKYTKALEDSASKLGSRIFCSAYDESLLERIFITAPSVPQVAIIFDTDEYETVDTVSWVNYLSLDIPYEFSADSKYHEYTVESVLLLSVVDSFIVSDATNIDDTQDALMGLHFPDLEKDCKYTWNRCGDACMLDFWGTRDAYDFVSKVTNCMICSEPLTTDDFDEVIRLVIKYFRKERKRGGSCMSVVNADVDLLTPESIREYKLLYKLLFEADAVDVTTDKLRGMRVGLRLADMHVLDEAIFRLRLKGYTDFNEMSTIIMSAFKSKVPLPAEIVETLLNIAFTSLRNGALLIFIRDGYTVGLSNLSYNSPTLLEIACGSAFGQPLLDSCTLHTKLSDLGVPYKVCSSLWSTCNCVSGLDLLVLLEGGIKLRNVKGINKAIETKLIILSKALKFRFRTETGEKVLYTISKLPSINLLDQAY